MTEKTLQELIDEQKALSPISGKTQRSINALIRYAEVDDEWRKDAADRISASTKGKSKSESARSAMSVSAKLRDNNQTGLKRDQSTKNKLSASRMAMSEEDRQAIARSGGMAGKGKPKAKCECPHCKKMIAINMFDRYHNDNCKSKS
jgi:hypothetical protein